MFIEKVMSRFSIRSKVLLVIIPMIAILAVVGGMGLTATGMLQSRLSLSIDTLKTLSGFRDVAQTMNQFLLESNQAHHDAALESLEQQRTTMQSLEESSNTAGIEATQLQSGAAAMSGITDSLNAMWTLHNTEEKLRVEILKNLEAAKSIRDSLRQA